MKSPHHKLQVRRGMNIWCNMNESRASKMSEARWSGANKDAGKRLCKGRLPIMLSHPDALAGNEPG